MSYKSAIASPKVSSGSVGSVFPLVQPAISTIALTSGVNSTLASVSVPAGVYSVNMCVNLAIANTAVLTSSFLTLGITPVGGSISYVHASNAVSPFTATADVSRQVAPSATIVVSSDSVVSLILYASFTIAGVSSIAPVTLTNAFQLQLIKIA